MNLKLLGTAVAGTATLAGLALYQQSSKKVQAPDPVQAIPSTVSLEIPFIPCGAPFVSGGPFGWSKNYQTWATTLASGNCRGERVKMDKIELLEGRRIIQTCDNTDYCNHTDRDRSLTAPSMNQSAIYHYKGSAYRP